MAEGEKSGMGAGKIVLIVVLILAGIGAICCAGMWFMGGRYAWHIGKGAVVMATSVQAELGDGSTAAPVPDEDGRFVVLVGVKGELTPETIVKAQDVGWKAYVKAFEDGGFNVKGVGVGKVGGGAGGVVKWKKNFVTAEELAARTGVKAPPTVEWLDKLNEGDLKVEVNGGDGGGDDEEDEDGGGGEPEKR